MGIIRHLASASKGKGSRLWPSSLVGSTSFSLPFDQCTRQKQDVFFFSPVFFRVFEIFSTTTDQFVFPTFNMAGKTNKKDKKSGPRPSTSSQGKAPSRSFSQSQKFTYDSDSSVGFIEDEFDAYEPPKTRGSKGAKSSKKSSWTAQDFVKNPSNFPVKIKQEPVSPTKE